MAFLTKIRSMGLFSRRHEDRAAKSSTLEHFKQFISTHRGVEAYYERPTTREPSSLMLVAATGEWTRRRVPDEREGAKLASSLGIPFYEVARVGYPDSVRQWNETQRRR